MTPNDPRHLVPCRACAAGWHACDRLPMMRRNRLLPPCDCIRCFPIKRKPHTPSSGDEA